MGLADKLRTVKAQIAKVEEEQQSIDQMLNSQSGLESAIEEEEKVISRINRMEDEIYSLMAGPEHVLKSAENLLRYEKFVLIKAREITGDLNKARWALEAQNPGISERILGKMPSAMPEPDYKKKSPVYFLKQASKKADEVRQKRKELLGGSSEEVIDAIEFVFLSDNIVGLIEELNSLLSWVEKDEVKMEKVSKNLERKSAYQTVLKEEGETQSIEEKLNKLVGKEEEIQEVRKKLNKLQWMAEADNAGIKHFLTQSQGYQGNSGKKLNTYLVEKYEVSRKFEEEYKELMAELQHMRDTSKALRHASENPESVAKMLIRDFGQIGLIKTRPSRRDFDFEDI